MSTRCVGDSLQWYQTPMFPAVFKEAGYNVVFYSNQFVVPRVMDVTDANLGYLCNPSISPKLFSAQNKQKYQYDMQLIEDYQRHRSQIEKPKNNLVIFHLMGQHIAPEMRYPETETYFTAKDINRPDLSQEQRQQIANYDNATRYNDKVVDRIISMYDDKEAVIIYFADHGDEVNDFRAKIGRSADFKDTGAPVFHNQLDIPFIIYPTKSLCKKNPELIRRMQQSCDKPFMIDALPYMLYGIAGISTKWYDGKRDLFSSDYDVNRRRLMESYFLDYDYYVSRK